MELFHVEPDTLYSLTELRDLLAGIVDLSTLLERLELRDNRVFRDAVWGFEILEAARKSKPFSQISETPAQVLEMARGTPSARGRKSTGSGAAGRLSVKDLREST